LFSGGLDTAASRMADVAVLWKLHCAEVARLYGVLDRQLAENRYVAGDFHSIADIALWGWCSLWEGQQQTLDDKPHLERWLDDLGAREGVRRGRALYADLRRDPAAKPG
jgi:GST-like protein